MFNLFLAVSPTGAFICLPLLGSSVAGFLGRFIGTGSCPIIYTFIALLLLLVALIVTYRILVSKGKKSYFLFFVILIRISVFCTFARYLCFSLLAGMASACIWQVSSSSGN
jgi:hypothetical protein